MLGGGSSLLIVGAEAMLPLIMCLLPQTIFMGIALICFVLLIPVALSITAYETYRPFFEDNEK